MILHYNLTNLLDMLPWRRLKKQKDRVREHVAQRRRILEKSTASELSEQIVSAVSLLPEFINSHTVMLYYPIHREVDLLSLARQFPDKIFVLPVTHRHSIEARLYCYGDRLHHGRFGIPEPKGPAYRGEIDLILVPGIAFDTQCNRLGRGGGYYDRFLRKLHSAFKIGVGYDFQLLDTALPVSGHDQRVDMVVTEKRQIRC